MEKMRQVRSALLELGFISKQGRGSHEVWFDPNQPKRRIVLYGKNSKDAPKYQTSRVRRFKRGMMTYQW